ncbi:hypothetical protein BVRB_5g116770 [Beta vulgaris subsp. vulgaris]|nr:hypothetical protein BVRB_5g116770 [Beta vulgaris subsp. vulgaris]
MSDDKSTQNINRTPSKAYVKATISVQKPSLLESLTTNVVDKLRDTYADCMEEAVLVLDLVSVDELQPNTGSKKLKTKYAYDFDDRSSEGLWWYMSHQFKKFWYNVVKIHSIFFNQTSSAKVELLKYVGYIEVEADFGEVGAVLVENEHHVEMHLIDIVLEGLPSGSGSLNISCNSWVHPKTINPDKRVFFTNKSYLASQTPIGLKKLREKELEILRGNGKGVRKSSDRIYDYDIYNDLCDPKDTKLKRQALGGTEGFPYPRRCRTGCPINRGIFSSVYVPRDERFSGLKQEEFGFSTLHARLHTVVPSLWEKFLDPDLGFPYMTAINLLFNEGSDAPEMVHHGTLQDILPKIIREVSDHTQQTIRLKPPQTFQRDGFSWFKDEEFARQTLAGMNPLSIKCVKAGDWPLMSKLDPKDYGPPESALTEDLVNSELKGSMTVEKALEDKRLFIIDYHDAYLPYVENVSKIEGRNLYGSRTLFIYDDETLKPLAIELTRPPYDKNPQWKRVFKPRSNATDGWLWKLAKAHVLAHDSSYHQLISHWLRTHCCTEPYIIAANRQLSEMHPIYRLLHPHFRYTMEINALARQALINADGIIEKTFTTSKYSLELCSTIYGSEWRFDHEALPADLISRGMAYEDEDGVLKLTIDDYPYAKDGLDLWFIIKKWVTDYVNYYYDEDHHGDNNEPSQVVESDEELQAWWTEIRTIGHGDKKDEPWWPTLKTPKDLIHIVTTIIWVCSGHHAAVNFGQYAYAGYFPNRPTITRTKMPVESSTKDEWNSFIKTPEKTLLACFPSQRQAATVMLVLDVLSSHSTDEEYLGQHIKPSWEAVPKIKQAFKEFNDGLTILEQFIDQRNDNEKLKHRNGAGLLPYELLKRYSDHGVTGMGVPNSISI